MMSFDSDYIVDSSDFEKYYEQLPTDECARQQSIDKIERDLYAKLNNLDTV